MLNRLKFGRRWCSKVLARPYSMLQLGQLLVFAMQMISQTLGPVYAG